MRTPVRITGGVTDHLLTTSTVAAADGRTIAFCEWGDPAGAPVFSLHGTPGSRLGRHHDESVYTESQVRLITYDRAGYGRSTRLPGRAVAHAAADVAAIADALGIDRFAITGGSGGGPHALACAALLGDRVTRCASVVGVAPVGDGGMPLERFFTGMTEGNVREITWAQAGESTLRPELERQVSEMLPQLGSVEGMLGEGYEVSESDLAVLRQSAIRARIEESVREGVGRTADGFVDDDLSFARPWGFSPAEIEVPVAVWYGTDDTLVPRGHGEWLLETIPGAEAVVLEGGHFAIQDRLPELLAWLTDGAGR